MSRPWRDKYPLCSLRGDGDDERFEAFACWQPVAMRRRSAPDRDEPQVDRRHRAKQLALARRTARRERRRLAGSALVAEPMGVVRESRTHGGHHRPGQLEQRRTDAGHQAEQAEQCSSWPVDDKTQQARSRRRRSSHSTAGGHRKNGGRPHASRRHS